MKRLSGYSRMKMGLVALLITATGVLVGSKGMASHVVSRSEDVLNTKHNLVINPDIGANGTDEVCVFCHTPHGGTRVDPDNSAPLWNRMLPNDVGFDMYSGPNFDGSDIGNAPKGVSLACLSCHDGTIALDALVNAPGSGGFIPGNFGTGSGPGTSAPNINFTGAGIVDADSTLREGQRNATDPDTAGESPSSGGIHDTVTGGLGAEGAEPFPNLTRDLRDDHPISMEVPAPGFNARGGKVDLQFEGIGAGSDFDGGTDGTNVKFIRRSDQQNWPADKRDRIRAYPSTAQAGSYYIECASCHNPHTPRVSFLRLPSGVPDLVTTNLKPLDTTTSGKTWAQRPNFSSAICLSCHQK